MDFRVLIVGDIRLYREGLAHVLQNGGYFSIVGQASGPKEAVETTIGLQPDIVLVDMAMQDALYTVERLMETAPASRVIALTVRETEQEILACAEAGVAGYVTRDATVLNVIESIRAVSKGEFQCSGRIAATLLRRIATLSNRRSVDIPLNHLTSRESSILALVNEGLSNKAIARQLNIEIATVKNHIHSILEKLHVHRREEAAALLRRARTEGPHAI